MEIVYKRLLPLRTRLWLRSLVVECGLPSCRGFHLSHALLTRTPGIFLDQTWYCSHGCLREALKQRVETQLGGAITDLRHPPRMPFRLILLAGGKVTEAQLAQARTVQAGKPGEQDLGDALVSLGFATEDEVAAARATEAGCLYFAAAPQIVAPAYSLPSSLVRLYWAAPVHFSPTTNRLLIGFVYRIDSSLLQAAEQVLGCRVEACMITASAWRKQMVMLAPTAWGEINKAAYRQGRIVNLIVEQALDSHADKLRVGLSSSALWARLTGESKSLDLVIDLASDAAESERETSREADQRGVEKDSVAPAATNRLARYARRLADLQRSSATP